MDPRSTQGHVWCSPEFGRFKNMDSNATLPPSVWLDTLRSESVQCVSIAVCMTRVVLPLSFQVTYALVEVP